MDTILLGYDLNKAGKNYEGLIAAIKELANGYWHHLDSTWLIRTSLSPSQVRDALGTYLDSDDEMLVLKVTGCSWASKGIDQSGNDWLHKYL